jgi:Predicted membrane protein
MNWLNRYTDLVYCIVRIPIGLMFACHGGNKILFSAGPIRSGWIELSCGFLIAFGFLTRLAAFLASGEMAVAYFLTSFSGRTLRHGPTILERVFPILNGGEMAVV